MTIKSLLPLMLSLLAGHAFANYSQRDDVQDFIRQMVERHGFDRKSLQQQFARAERLDDVLEKIARPAEKTLNWKQYQRIFLTQKRLRGGIEFMRRHRDLLKRAEQRYGVPAAIITAVIGVETYYGKHSGRTAVFDSLTTLGFDYPPRARFFRSELEQLLLLAREEDIDVKTVRGSYAGAMGMPQFISSSYRRYAVDFDQDGKRDLWHSLEDVVGSVANYFHVHGWRKGEPVLLPVAFSGRRKPGDNKLKPYQTVREFVQQGVTLKTDAPADARATLLTFEGKNGVEHWLGLQNFYVITRYNHSALYAMAVYHLSEQIRSGLDEQSQE